MNPPQEGAFIGPSFSAQREITMFENPRGVGIHIALFISGAAGTFRTLDGDAFPCCIPEVVGNRPALDYNHQVNLANGVPFVGSSLRCVCWMSMANSKALPALVLNVLKPRTEKAMQQFLRSICATVSQPSQTTAACTTVNYALSGADCDGECQPEHRFPKARSGWKFTVDANLGGQLP